MENAVGNNSEYALKLKNITKVFPGVKALDNVTMQLKRGEILALIGENGAGKSTLINCITGVYEPEEGEIEVNGKPIRMTSPQTAFNAGISVVHQERNLIPTFDVAENIFFERICGNALGTVNKKRIHKDAEALLKRVGLNVKPTDSIEKLSSAQKQVLEIARALSTNANILLLDEPTASISLKEVDMLLDTVRELKNQGVSIIYISHKLEELFEIADRVKVIRDGKSVSEELPISEIDRDRLIELMVGSREMKQAFPQRTISDEIVLQAKNISSKMNSHENSVTLHKGEIQGWYGLVGSGRTELARELIGIDPIKKGELRINSAKVSIRSYKEAFEKHRIYYLSENRKEEGLFLMHSIATNMNIVALDKVKNKLGFHSYAGERAVAEQYKKTLSIKMGNATNPVSSLSGGNQQKVCIAKALITQPEIIIVDEPTVGIDVKTKAEIYRLIYDLAEEGRSIIMISSDISELIRISDRIIAFKEGSIVGDMENRKNYDEMSTKIMEAILM